MKTPSVKWLFAALGLVLLLVAGFALSQRKTIVALARDWDTFTEGAPLARKLRTADDVLDYIATHRGSVSLAWWVVGEEEQGIFLNAETPRPLASTVKTMILAEYAAQVSAGALQAVEPVEVAAWESLWLPGTDGGAHPAAMRELRESDRVHEGRVTLGDVAHAMIRFSDNAATDLLLLRLGRERIASLPERLGLPNEEAPFPIGGQILAARGTQQDHAHFVDESWRIAERLRTDPVFRKDEVRRLEDEGLPPIKEQILFARTLNGRGTARGYARLMERVVTGTQPGSELMRAQLEWPMKNQPIREAFEAFGTKGGSLAGVLTSATFAKPKGKPPRVLALFFQDVPFAVWATMMKRYVQQDFERQLLSDDAFVEKVRQRLAAPAERRD